MIENIELYLKNDPFFGLEDPCKINTDTHKYVWGNCLVNKNTGVIDRVISKDKKYVGDVTYTDSHYGGIPSFEVRIAGRLVGYVSSDYFYYRSLMEGGNYWLNGIVKSYQILQEEAETRESIAKWNNTVESDNE